MTKEQEDKEIELFSRALFRFMEVATQAKEEAPEGAVVPLFQLATELSKVLTNHMHLTEGGQ